MLDMSEEVLGNESVEPSKQDQNWQKRWRKIILVDIKIWV